MREENRLSEMLGMSASPAIAEGALKCSAVSRNTHVSPLPDNAQITPARYAERRLHRRRVPVTFPLPINEESKRW